MEAASTALSGLSLVEQIQRLSPPAEQPVPGLIPEEEQALSDGYQRTTPVQAYWEPPELRRRRRIKMILTTVLTVAAVALLIAFMPRLGRFLLRMFR